MSKKFNKNETEHLQREYKEREEINVEENINMKINPIGMVVCNRLNVRSEPLAENPSNILCVISSGSEVIIDEDNSTEKFYAVVTSDGIRGFCMKQYISIK